MIQHERLTYTALVTMAQRALAARYRAEEECRQTDHRAAALADAIQRALMLAYVAQRDGGTVDPATLIACLTGRDTPHALPAAG